ncbi:MAG: aminotransferase class V-fold PLP-dependent enzyme [Proteobacteria bacterium]|nr:aminotransferase class V-fold PLP-dependent enzyme [Pseudomonadota bacterium]
MKDKIIYVDAAASALKPESVIAAEAEFLRNNYANAGRGVCARAAAVDDMAAAARAAVARFIGAARPEQIVFTSGTTDGMNRIPNILEKSGAVNADSWVAVSDLDHHSARMPWEELQHFKGIGFGVCPLDDKFNIDASQLKKALAVTVKNGNGRARIRKPDVFIITAMSNVLGVPQDVKGIIAAARAINPQIVTIVDAAQYVAHLPIDVTDWDCDFLCFSGHKIGADTGIGVMYVKDPKHWFPDKFGGGMVAGITGSLATNDSRWTLAAAPAKFEAGTLPLTQIVGLGAAIEEMNKSRTPSHLPPHRGPHATGFVAWGGHEGGDAHSFALLNYLRAELSKVPRIKFVSPEGAHIITFTVDGMHPLDFGALMGARNVCLRVGNMCASWIHARLGLLGTIRISVGPWNTMAEMEELARIIKRVAGK